jgi:hypothetical protein
LEVAAGLGQDWLQALGHRDGPHPVGKAEEPCQEGVQEVGEFLGQAGKLHHRLRREEGGEAQEEAKPQVDQDHPQSPGKPLGLKEAHQGVGEVGEGEGGEEDLQSGPGPLEEAEA